MASDYGINFGFRRSDESVRVSEGRLKTPVGSALQQGTLVTFDTSSAGYLKQAVASAPVVPGYTGLLVQEEIWDRPIYSPELVDSYQIGICLPNRLSVISTGAGVKFWIKNTAGFTQADGRVVAAVTMFDPTSIAVGDGIAWNGTEYVHVAAGDATEIARVTFYDSTALVLEAVLVK
jgi:hypothetical protein